MRFDFSKALVLATAVLLVQSACSSNGPRSSSPVPVNQEAVQQVSTPTLDATLPASWDENWFASPAVYDLDDDGENEIIASRHSVVYVWNSSGELRWRAPAGEDSTSDNDHGTKRQYASPVVGDLDGDGNGEIAIAYGNKAAVYDHNGKLLDGWPQAFPEASDEIRSIAAADLDLDGAMEILVVKTSGGPVTLAWHIWGEVVSGWPQVQGYEQCYDYGGYNQNIGSADLDGDNIPEVISTYDCCHIGIMYADGMPYPANSMFSGPYVNSIPMFHSTELAIQGWGPDGEDRDEFTDSPPVFGDIDNDGLPEIIVYSDHEKAGEYKNRGNALWVLNPDLSRVSGFEQPIKSTDPLYTGYKENIVQVAPSPALANLTGDVRPEILVPSYDGYMRCFSPDGIVLWDYEFDSPGGDFIGASGPVIGDLSNDGLLEIIFTTYSIADSVSHLVILDIGGNELHKISLDGRGSMSPPTLADVDKDGTIEVVISLKDTLGNGQGGVQIWDVPSAHNADLPWFTGRGNYLRDGQLGA